MFEKKEWACFHGCWLEASSLSLGPPWRSVHTVVFGTSWGKVSKSTRWKPPHRVCSTLLVPLTSLVTTWNKPHKARYIVTTTWDYLGFLTPHTPSFTDFRDFLNNSLIHIKWISMGVFVRETVSPGIFTWGSQKTKLLDKELTSIFTMLTTS